MKTFMKNIYQMFCRLIHHVIFDYTAPVFYIMKKDIKTIVTSVSSIIIIIALCLVPSCYALLNIYSLWDPYSRTGNLPIAIINNDEGGTFNNSEMNVGKNLVKDLKKNHSIKWIFVDDWQGNYGLNNGNYYALIEIPHNFTERLLTLASSSPQKPIITYRVNEKLNAMAPKFVNAAKTQLTDSIKSGFVKSLSEEMLNTVQGSTLDLTNKDSKIEKLKNAVINMNNDMKQLQDLLKESNGNIDSYQNYLSNSQSNISKITQEIDSLEKINTASGLMNQSSNDSADRLNTAISNHLKNADQINEDNQKLISELKNINSTVSTSDIKSNITELMNTCDTLHQMLTTDIKNLKTLNFDITDSVIRSISLLDESIVNEKNSLNDILPQLDISDSQNTFQSNLNTLSKYSEDVKSDTFALSNTLSSSSPNNTQDQSGKINNTLESVKSIVPLLNTLSNFSQNNNQLSKQQLDNLKDVITKVQTKLQKVIDTLDSSNSKGKDILGVINDGNSSNLANFLASPVNVKQVNIYKSGPTGYSMAPFYTVLSIWVGVLLLSAIISSRPKKEIYKRHISFLQGYLGKFLLFVIISQIQTLLVISLELTTLGLRPVNIGLYYALASLYSLTFTSIIFTLAYSLGTLGSGIGFVVMIFQMAGSGGLYPIETTPVIFGKLAPLWPFTYAINGLREAIEGPIKSNVIYDVKALLLFLLGFLVLVILIALVIKFRNVFLRIFKRTA